MVRRDDVSVESAHRVTRALRQRLEDLARAGVTHLPRVQPGTDAFSDSSEAAGDGQSQPREIQDRSFQPPPSDPQPQASGAAAMGPDATSALPSGPAPSLFDAMERAPAVPPEERPALLQALSEEVSQCTRCSALVECRTQTVFGVGHPQAELCFVGEAPGRDEDEQGEPFVGRAGQLLDRIIAACQMRREDVYIGNILKCRPPENRTPLPDEIANCRPYLERQLEILRPRFICCLGSVAAQSLLGVNQSMSKLRGRFFKYRDSQVLCTYHPAYLLRNPSAKAQVWEDMKMLMAAMGRPIR